MMLEKTFKKKT